MAPYIIWVFIVLGTTPTILGPIETEVASYTASSLDACNTQRDSIVAFIKKEELQNRATPCEKRVIW